MAVVCELKGVSLLLFSVLDKGVKKFTPICKRFHKFLEIHYSFYKMMTISRILMII